MSAAFKEWAIVCEALGDGRQSVILRKGGIAEGRQGFAFQHDEFFLFPTWFHEQREKTILDETWQVPAELPGEVEIRFAVAVEWARLIRERAALQALREFHVLHDSVVEERFNYDGVEGIHVAFVRVFRLDPPCRLAHEKRFGGCRSWIDLPEFEGCTLVSVLSDEEHARRRDLIETRLGAAAPA